eukprot:2734523-Rhodomonas_salina.1
MKIVTGLACIGCQGSELLRIHEKVLPFTSSALSHKQLLHPRASHGPLTTDSELASPALSDWHWQNLALG